MRVASSAVAVCLLIGCGDELGRELGRSSNALGPASRVSWTAMGATQPASGTAGVTLPTMRVAVTDSMNNGVPTSTALVTLSVSGNAATLSGTVSVNAVGGIATFDNVLLTKTGTFRLIAQATGLNSATSTTFTVIAAAEDHLEFTVQPTNVNTGTNFSPAVQVSVLDAFDNPVTNPQTVVVAIQDNPGASTLSGTTTLNTTTGRATFSTLRLNRPGTAYTLRATCGSLSSLTSAAFDVLRGPATRLVAISGGGQSVNVAAAAPFPLVVEAQDVSGNPVPGVQVDWTVVSGGGSTTPSMSWSDAAGRTQTSVTMGTTSGTQRYEARSAGLTTAVFNLTGRALAASQLVYVAGDGQTGAAGTALAGPLTVRVTDVYGNGIANQVVTFSVVSGGGTVVLAAPRTDSTGSVSATATLGAAIGPNVFQAARTGLAGTPIVFNATGTPGAAAQLAFVSLVSPVTVSTAVTPFDVTVRDAFGNPIDGAAVTLSADPGAALTGTTTRNSAGGVATFDDLSFGSIGSFTLTAASGAASATASVDVACGGGLTGCAGQCVDTASDSNHCGTCGTTCGGAGATAVACVNGQCAVTSCQIGRGDCDATAANGCETALATNALHCGACGRACPSGVMCVQGLCGSDDAEKAFTAANPSGPWSYGWRPNASAPETFTPFNAGSTDGEGNVWQHDSSGPPPTVIHNGTGAVSSPFGATMPDGTLALMPGTSSEAVLRYTIQADGVYRVSAEATGLAQGSATVTLSETRRKNVQFCRVGGFFCIGTTVDYANPFHPDHYCGVCGSVIEPRDETQTTTRSVPARTTTSLQVRVNGASAWGPGLLNDTTHSSSVSFFWSEFWNYFTPAHPQFYSWLDGDNTIRGALTLTLKAGDQVDFAVGPWAQGYYPGGTANANDLTQVKAVFQLACPSGFADCDGDPANGCEVELAMQGGKCDRSLISVSNDGLEAEDFGEMPRASADGRYVIFKSNGRNLGTHGQGLYLRDRVTETTKFIAPNDGTSPRITPDGRWVVFSTSSSTLVAGDTNNTSDVFVYDRITETFERVSTDSSDAQADGYSHDATISDDGRFVAFVSGSSNLVTDDGNSIVDVFVKDRASRAMRRIVGPAGALNSHSYYPNISGDGTVVAFTSSATNISGDSSAPDAFAADLVTGEIERFATGNYGYARDVSADGRYLLINGQDNYLYLADRRAHTVDPLMVAGQQARDHDFSPDLSPDGRWVGFATQQAFAAADTENDIDLHVLDRVTGSVELVTAPLPGRSHSSGYHVEVTGNAREVLFTGFGGANDPRSGRTGSQAVARTILRPAEVYSTDVPPTVASGGTFGFRATLFDERGLRVGVSNLPITVAVLSGPAGAVLGGTTTLQSTQGSALFSGLSLDLAGGYVLQLSSPGFASRQFAVTVGAGAPARLVIVSGDAQTTTVATVLTPFVVRLEDAAGNPIAGATVDWAVAAGGGSLDTASSVTDASGAATASGTLGTAAGMNAFTAASGAFSVSFSAVGTPGAPAALVWTNGPFTATAGVIIAPAPVVVLVDAYNNPVDNLSATAHVFWNASDLFFVTPSVRGTLDVPLVGGYGTFSDLYAFEATSGDLIASVPGGLQTNALLTIVAGPPSGAYSGIGVNPATAQADGTSTITVTVIARDQFGNDVSNAAAEISVTGTGNIVAQPGLTVNGAAAGTLASTRAETKTISATLNGVAVQTTMDVTFTPLANCAAGTGDCNGDALDGCETDTTSSVSSCGACGNACSMANAAAACTASACTVGSCSSGFRDCDGNAANGCETDLAQTGGYCDEEIFDGWDAIALSGNGRVVAARDGNGVASFIDRVTGQVRVGVPNSTNTGNSVVTQIMPQMSSDGSLVGVYEFQGALGHAVGPSPFYLYNPANRQGIVIAPPMIPANHYMAEGRISADTSVFTYFRNQQLLPPDHLYHFNRFTFVEELVNVDNGGNLLPAISFVNVLSGDGQRVFFRSSTTEIHRRDLAAGVTASVTGATNFVRSSYTGRFTVSVGGCSGFNHYDWELNRLECVPNFTVTNGIFPASTVLTDDGRWVFGSSASGFAVYDSWTHAQYPVVPGGVSPYNAAGMSADGRFVAWSETATGDFHTHVVALIRPAEAALTAAPGKQVSKEPFSVTVVVRNDHGVAVPGVSVPVSLRVNAGDQFLSGTTAGTTTDSTITFGSVTVTTPGDMELWVESPGYASPHVRLYVDQPPPTGIIAVSGDNQSISFPQQFAPLTVRVVDVHGDGVPGQQVVFTGSDPALFSSPYAGTTNAAGEVTIALGAASIAGQQVVHAQSGAFGVDFHLEEN